MMYEVCCGCTEDALRACQGGADRIELNSALFLGGLTPSLGTLIEVKKLVDIPVMAMVRPREGGFNYTKYEYETMLTDAKLLLKHGADGLVFAFLNENGSINIDRTKEFKNLCGDKEAVFSRGIDVASNIIQSTKILDEIGIDRVLTSGGEESAYLGMDNIKKMVEVSTKMEILPGGGINKDNAVELMEKTGANQVHSSARTLHYDTSVRNNPKIFFGGKIDGKSNPEDEYKITDSTLVKEMKEVIGR